MTAMVYSSSDSLKQLSYTTIIDIKR